MHLMALHEEGWVWGPASMSSCPRSEITDLQWSFLVSRPLHSQRRERRVKKPADEQISHLNFHSALPQLITLVSLTPNLKRLDSITLI